MNKRDITSRIGLASVGLTLMAYGVPREKYDGAVKDARAAQVNFAALYE